MVNLQRSAPTVAPTRQPSGSANVLSRGRFVLNNDQQWSAARLYLTTISEAQLIVLKLTIIVIGVQTGLRIHDRK
jgi:hypothetical protein